MSVAPLILLPVPLCALYQEDHVMLYSTQNTTIKMEYFPVTTITI